MPGRALRTIVLVVAAASVLALAAPMSCADSGSILRKVPFTFVPSKGYARVFLAGTFNGWSTEATRMSKVEDHFEIDLLLPVGKYQYKFVADGEWIADETAEGFAPDGFGGQNSVVTVDDSFAAVPLEVGDGRIVTEHLGHGRNAWEVMRAADGSVSFRTRVWTGDAEAVTVRWRASGGEAAATGAPFAAVPMERVDGDGLFDYYAARLEAGEAFDYFFEIEDGGAVFRQGPDGLVKAPDSAGEFHFDAGEFPVFETPDWVKEGIIYQIFPERFANGNPDNDPDFSEWYYEGVTDLPNSGRSNEEYFHLVHDWYDIDGLTKSPYRTDDRPDWYSFYGGDVAGIHQHLDYLTNLGITIVYLNPIFEAKSNHKYDAASYTEIDPHFGTNAEFAAFVEACHARGIRVVIDLAFNHTGETFWAFVDTRDNGSRSEYWNWYEWKKWPMPEGWTSGGLEYYDCWWGFGQMPNLNFDLSRPNPEEHLVWDIEDAEVNWPVVDHLLDATIYWLTEIDVDGFRLDVAGEVPFWFWELFRERVREAKPDAYILGELWGASPEFVNGKYYDAVMNYRFFRDPVLAFIARGETDAAEFDTAIAPGRFVYPDEGVRAMMNLLDSHDTERFLTTAWGDTRRLKLAILFGMTYVGAPALYYGDEIAMQGGGDPDCRRPFHWRWRDDPERADVHAYTRRLISLRKEHTCFARGSFRTLLAEGRVYAFHRGAPGDDAVVVMNAGTEPATVEVPLEAPPHDLMNVLTNETVAVARSGDGASFEVTLPPLTGYVFTYRKSGSER